MTWHVIGGGVSATQATLTDRSLVPEITACNIGAGGRSVRRAMPSRAMGGFAYEHSLILFRRIANNTFEFTVFPWDSDHARAYVEASRRQDLVFRVGRNSNRLAGFIP